MTVTRAVLYARVSTGRQAAEGVSLETQAEEAQRLCQQKGWVLEHTYLDVQTGTSSKRPQFKQLQEDAKAKRFDVVIFYKLDRLARSAISFYRLVGILQEHGIGLVSITEQIDLTTPMGKAATGMLAIFAEIFSDQLSERTRSGHRYVAARGQWLGGKNVPYGYAYIPGNKVLTVIPEEAEMVRSVFDTYLATRSVAQTTRRIMELGYRQHNGQPMKVSRISKILNNPVYTGQIAYGKTARANQGNREDKRRQKQDKGNWIVCENAHEAIIPRETFEAAQKLLAENTTVHARVRYSQQRYAWAGIFTCAALKPDGKKCGAPLLVRVSKFSKPGGWEWAHVEHQCQDRRQVGKVACPDYGRVSESFLDLVVVPELSRILERCAQPTQPAAKPKAKARPDRRVEKIAALQARRDRELDLYRGGLIGFDKLTSAVKTIDAQLAALEAVELDTKDPDPIVLPGKLSALWEHLAPSLKNELLRKLIEHAEASRTHATLYLRPFPVAGWPDKLVFEIKNVRTLRGKLRR